METAAVGEFSLVSEYLVPGGWILLQCLILTVAILISLAFLLYADRKIWAAVQLRRGQNVVGHVELLQSIADIFKFELKEIVMQAGSDKFVDWLHLGGCSALGRLA